MGDLILLNLIISVMSISFIGNLIVTGECLSCINDYRINGILHGTHYLSKISLFRALHSFKVRVVSIYLRLLILVAFFTQFIYFNYTGDYLGFAQYIHYYLIFNLAYLLYDFSRSPFGLDGAEQLNLLVTVSLLIGLSISDSALYVSLYFIFCQVIFSYAIAGISKAFGFKWRSGIALTEIMRTYTYGNFWFYSFLKGNPRVAKFITVFTWVWESFTLLAFYSKLWIIVTAALGFAFHLTNAMIIGLNNFLWAFCSTYPILYYFSHVDLDFNVFRDNYQLTVFYTLWLILTCLIQFNTKSLDWIRRLDKFNLLPTWTFFAPNPMVNDYYIYYCVRDEQNLDPQNIEWFPINVNHDRHISHIFWNPEKRKSKAFIDMVQSILDISREHPSDVTVYSSPYIALSLYIEQSIMGSNVPTENMGFQYLVMQNVGYEQEAFQMDENNLVFRSAFHPFD